MLTDEKPASINLQKLYMKVSQHQINSISSKNEEILMTAKKKMTKSPEDIRLVLRIRVFHKYSEIQ